ncbi:carbon starvation protein A [uncultured Bacteroides sp.]|uniref:carbon starvation CstA family protein n=1 Tax=uncultured Bacteroides sp. TaxID=162156 RepID=UPI00261D9091|nr:carbon starvation protein A [uncultured Bacteroides sp.]
MITFTIALILLLVGYWTYGKYINKLFAPDPTRKTPAETMADGVDFIPLPTWKIFMIQFLNIAGLGPIFGAIMGAQFGTASYLWIVFGTIFAGAVHDFLSGGLSLRHSGESLPEIIGRFLGTRTKRIACVFTVLLMILVGAVFVSGPAELLAGMTPDYMDAYFWIVVIFIYYVLATLMPVDKIIGKIYPLFAFALLFMAVGILVMLYVKNPDLPEMWNGFGTKYEKNPIFPMMFISIACGAISGFHATQSPLMARCISNEKYCRPIFYGAMVTEGVVALIWAAAATYFFHSNGIVNEATGVAYSGAMVATEISKDWLGTFGGILAILGIVAAPITSGDTALRSARLIVADFFHMEQRSIRNRMMICVPIFFCTIGLLLYSFRDVEGFKIIWRYFAWCNQTLSVFTLWTITVWLVQEKKNYWVTLIPALFMTCVCSTYLLIAPEGFSLSPGVAYLFGGLCSVVAIVWFVIWYNKYKKKII